MSGKRIYECKPCLQFFKGRVQFDYHMNAHRRTALTPKKELAPKRPVGYTESAGGTAPES